MSNFYKSSLWKNKRLKILRRDGYECRECKRYGKSVAATVVHHIFPLESYPEYRLVSANLYSCCGSCHGSFHDRITNELTAEGLRLLERKKREILK